VRGLLPSVLFNAVVPAVAYMVLRSTLDDVVALAVSTAIPVAATLVSAVVRRRLDPVGVVSVAAFAVVLLITVASGGNPIVLELRDAVVTGPVGLVCVLSVVAGRPLAQVLFRFLARRDPRFAPVAVDRRASAVITLLVGGTLVLHALVLLCLALTVPTTTYLVLSTPVGVGVITAGGLALLAHRRARLRARRAAQAQA
jgi:hypothetical protein